MSALQRRWAGLALGMVTFVALTLEQRSPLVMLWLALAWMGWRFPPRATCPWCLAGSLFAVPCLAALFMVLQNGIHGHSVPDFPNAVILAMLARAPWWGAAGGLLGLAWQWWTR